MCESSLPPNYSTERKLLNLNDLSTGSILAITPAMGAALAEASGVCLESQGHTPGVRITVRGYRDSSYALAWQPTTAQARRSWNDPRDATEMGAEGIAILLAKAEIGYDVLRRSWQGTGFDYWMGMTSASGLQDMAGLEISGIRNGDDRTVRARVREKLQQVNQSVSRTPDAYVIVVEFGTPLAEVQRNERNE